jgi:hypothetical protein
MRITWYRLLKIYIILYCAEIFSDPIRFNNIDPYPLFSSNNHYNMLTEQTRKLLRYEKEDESINETSPIEEVIHISIFPFYQSASSGADIYGNTTVTDYDYSLTTTLTPTSNASAIALDNISPTQQNTTALISTIPLPLGAIPECFSYTGLLAPWSTKDSIEPWYYNPGDESKQQYNYDLVTGKTYGNLVSKVIGRALGFSHLAQVDTGSVGFGETATLAYDPLYFDYSNYRNDFFNVLAYPLSRDPSQLFGYGYFDMEYQKYGLRTLIEFRPLRDCGIRIYTGFSSMSIDKINIIDTTTNSQGPVAAHMFARYPDQITPDASQAQSIPSGAGLYVSPNIYSLTPLDTVPLDNNPNAIPYSKDKPFFTDYLKTMMIQNIQNNTDALGRILKQDFGPHYNQGFEDTTAELYYRKLVLYENKSDFPLYAIMPHASIRVTAPFSERILANKIFGKPLGNNGHWEFGGMMGCVFDFLHTISFGIDISGSIYSDGIYKRLPVPVKDLEQGIFTYTADVNRQPGTSISFGFGMFADEFLSNTSIFTEYRFVNHFSDSFTIRKIYSPLDIVTMSNTHRIPNYLEGEMISNFNTDPSSYEDVTPGVMYLQQGQPIPLPNESNIKIDHLKKISVWSIHMINVKLKFAISDYTSFGFAWQQPFAMTNAFNSSTVGFALEMMY